MTKPPSPKRSTSKASGSKTSAQAAALPQSETPATSQPAPASAPKTSTIGKTKAISKAQAARLQWICQQLQATDHVDPRQQRLSKHEKMASNAFRFMRGSAGLFYADLHQGVLQLPSSIAAWPLTMVQGDCHLSNLGLFTEEGSHGDLIKFGPNDFDDACVGHAGWDLLRLSLSYLLAVEYCQDVQQGLISDDDTLAALGDSTIANDAEVDAALQQLLRSYRQTCEQISADPEQRYTAITHVDKTHVLKPFFKKAIARSLRGDKFWTHSSLAKNVDISRLPLQFQDKPSRFTRLDASQTATLKHAFAPYAGDFVHDLVARQGAGTGSLNMQRYYLLVGPEHIQHKDDLTLCYLVEVKQQRAAAPLAFFAELSPMNRLNAAHLTVDCQRQMMRRPDIVLDELQWQGEHFLVRSLHHANVDIEPADVVSAKALWQYADACGRAMALVHNRGDRRSTRFADAVCNTPTEAWQQLIEHAKGYAKQQQLDCQLLSRQLSRLPATSV